MFDFAFPREWSTIKRLIWLKAAALVNAVLKTITGNPIHITDALAKPVQALSVAVEPIQDLHGYDNPWPAGGGKNLFDSSVFPESADQTIRYLHYVAQNGTYTMSTPGFPAVGEISNVYFLTGAVNSGASSGSNGVSRSTPRTITVTDGYYTVAYRSANDTNKNNPKDFKWQIESGSIATDWTPYSNICPISGWTEAKVTRTGINVWDGVTESGYIDVNTGEERASAGQRRSLFVSCKPSTQYCYVNTNAASGVRMAFYDRAKNYVGMFSNSNSNPQVFTTPANAYYLRFYWGDASGISINYPSTDTDYHSGADNETYSITFPSEAGTVYGGTLDVVNGKMTVDRAMVDLGTLTWASISGNRKQCTELTNSIAKPDSAAQMGNLIAERYATVNASALFSDSSLIGIAVNIGGYLIARTSGEEVSGKLVYELATPIEITLTPTQIDTLLGTNNVWADTGAVEGKYTLPFTITNPTRYDAQPLLRVYGAGNLGINGDTITISQADVYTDIDCEMMDAFKGAENRNQYITLTSYNFPVLVPGKNNFSLGAGITRVEITPRWWTV